MNRKLVERAAARELHLDRAAIGEDLDYVGVAFVEVIRDAAGNVIEIRHVRPPEVRRAGP